MHADTIQFNANSSEVTLRLGAGARVVLCAQHDAWWTRPCTHGQQPQRHGPLHEEILDRPVRVHPFPRSGGTGNGVRLRCLESSEGLRPIGTKCGATSGDPREAWCHGGEGHGARAVTTVCSAEDLAKEHCRELHLVVVATTPRGRCSSDAQLVHPVWAKRDAYSWTLCHSCAPGLQRRAREPGWQALAGLPLHRERHQIRAVGGCP